MACKVDLIEGMSAIVDVKRAQALAVSRGFVACVETSAKTGEGINEVFEVIAKEALRQSLQKVISPVDKVRRYCFYKGK